MGVFATFRFASGTPYTRCPGDSGDENVLSGTVCAKRIEGDYNGARLPMLKFFDMKLTKGFQLGGVDLTAYVDVRNLFNFRNILQVFTTTNDIYQLQWNGRKSTVVSCRTIRTKPRRIPMHYSAMVTST